MSYAILTPVPLVHLVDGQVVSKREGRVAFGSQAWEVFRDIDDIEGPGAQVLIYASHAGAPAHPAVSWTARYLRSVESRGGAHPGGSRLRPPSTIEGGEDASRYWAGFYEVEELTPLDDEARIAIGDLHDRKGHRYRRGFVPEGPIIISLP